VNDLFSKSYFSDTQADLNKRLVRNWLLTGCILIYLMVLTGGITRLTHSGLSMVDWNFVIGSFPPVSEQDWTIPFEKYKLSPEYKLINNNFSLQEFKSIYWWEYSHRFIGRSIGLFFILPFIHFTRKKIFTKEQFQQSCFLLFLGILQGLLGWFMVKSGLKRIPHVDHFRLAMHLGNAFLLFYFAFTYFNRTSAIEQKHQSKSGTATILIWMIFIQILFGALVSGLKAGLIYNTYPLMGSEFIPTGLGKILMDHRMVLSDGASVQFLHRMTALLVLGLTLKVVYDFRKNKDIQKARMLLLTAILIQFTLGVSTLLSHVPVFMGVLHQAGAFFMFSAAIYFKQSLK
jgi:cytochrome c oxidase assembly protein subunit 15